MATSKKVDVVKKTKVKEENPAAKKSTKEYTSDIDAAMKLGVKLIKTGSHLTVITYPNGRQELKWNDEALARDVREAIASVEK